MAVPIYHSPEQVCQYNEGYTDGYRDLPELQLTQSQDYLRGYLAGREQLQEDQEAMQSGNLDNLSEAERDFLYGREERYSDYRS